MIPTRATRTVIPATRQLFQSVLTSITGTSAPEPARRPYLVSPVQLLSDSIREFFQRPGMVGAVNAWKIRPRTPGESRSIQDGKVWRNIKGHDGQSFFYGDSSKTEIRLGTTIGLAVKRAITDHLTPPECCRPVSRICWNLNGPTEPTADQLQHHLKVVVDQLIILYEEGILIKTAEYPDGITVRVALVGIIADHPAIQKPQRFTMPKVHCSARQTGHKEVPS
ncbi:hypothetical protein B0H10DRAFT_1960963 [Mycena sp. CBHHK59/15]|nr:hypothetical protein B0H10DRAFT_1960963 [Mycena sp. CBHHK59/15]